MIDSIETWVYDSVLDVNNFILNDLVPQTDYYVYVRSYCSNGVNQEWSSLLFNTECERVNYLLFYGDFESYGAGAYVMQCWCQVLS